MLSKQPEQREIHDILSVFFVVVNGPLKKYRSFYSPHINKSWTGKNVVAKWLTRLLCTRMREVSSSNLSPETEVFVVFLSSYKRIPGQYLKLGCHRFLPSPVQFIIRLSPFHSTLYSELQNPSLNKIGQT
jgi:hypothetical protein